MPAFETLYLPADPFLVPQEAHCPAPENYPEYGPSDDPNPKPAVDTCCIEAAADRGEEPVVNPEGESAVVLAIGQADVPDDNAPEAAGPVDTPPPEPPDHDITAASPDEEPEGSGEGNEGDSEVFTACEANPVDAAAAQRELAKMHGEANSHLTRLVTPIAEVVSDRVIELIQEPGFNDRLDRNPEPIVHGLPYRSNPGADPYTLPPLLFGTDPTRDTFELPEDHAGRVALVESFIETRAGTLDDPGMKAICTEDEVHRLALPVQLQRLHRAGATIDPQKWRAYMGAAQQQLDAGYYTLEPAGEHRAAALASMLTSEHKAGLVFSPLTAQLDSFVLRTNALRYGRNGSINTLTGFIQLPVGAYGRELTETLLEATELMVETASDLEGLAAIVASGSEEVIATYMGKGQPREGSTAGEALIEANQKGTVLIAQIIDILTAEYVPGYDDPIPLVRDIVNKGLIEQFTRAVPEGLVGSFSLAGLYFPGLVQNSGNGPVLHPDIILALQEIREAEITKLPDAWARHNKLIEAGIDDVPAPEQGLFCPAANGAIAQQSQALAAALQARITKGK